MSGFMIKTQKSRLSSAHLGGAQTLSRGRVGRGMKRDVGEEAGACFWSLSFVDRIPGRTP